MKIYKNKAFAKFAHKERISDEKLREVIKAADNGKIDADYGGGVIKQRIARPHEGKSGGYRAILLFRKGTRAFFVYGFPKKDCGNITGPQEKAFKELARETLDLDERALALLVQNGTYQEVIGDG